MAARNYIFRVKSKVKNIFSALNKICFSSELDKAMDNEISLELKTFRNLLAGYKKDRPNEHFALHPEVLSDYYNPPRIKFFIDTIAILDKHFDLSGKTILDVGTYVPYFLYMVSKRHEKCRFLCFDLDISAINLGKYLLPEASFYEEDFFSSGNDFSHADLIICTQVLEHLVHPDKALKKLLNCKNNQTIFLSVPDGRQDDLAAGAQYSPGSYEGHINFWSPESWQVFLEANCDKTYCKIVTGHIGQGGNLFAIITKSSQV